LDDKYFEWKEIILHSILEPVLTKTDSKHFFDMYTTRNTPELVNEYSKELVARIYKNYNQMHFNKLMFMVRLVRPKDIELIKQKGFMEDAVFFLYLKKICLKHSLLLLLTLSLLIQ
jgi:hypothetical protein